MAKITDFQTLIKDLPIMEITRNKHGFYLRCGVGDMLLNNHSSVSIGKLSDIKKEDVARIVNSIKPTLAELKKGLADFLDHSKASHTALDEAISKRDWSTVRFEAEYLERFDAMIDKLNQSILATKE